MPRAVQERAGAPITATVRSLRWIVVALLVVSALTTLFLLPALDQAVGAGRLPDGVLVAPSVLLALCVVVYAAYRFLLVRAGRYGAGKALVQIAVLAIVVGIVGGASLDRYRAARAGGGPELSRALAAPDPVTRALAAEVVRHRPRSEALRHGDALVALLGDGSAEVRRQAHLSLVAIVGEDRGEGAESADRWRAALASPGRDHLPQ